MFKKLRKNPLESAIEDVENLEGLQENFSRDVFESDLSQPNILSQTISDKPDVGREKLVQIHRNNTLKSLTAVLRSTFPVIVQIVGDDFFNAMAHRFIVTHPPRSGCLTDYGDELAAFIQDFPPAASLPYLKDIADLEWAWHRAYHASDQKPLDPSELLDVDPEHNADLRLYLHRSASLISSPYAIDAIWQAHQEDGHLEDDIAIDSHATWLLVMRPHYKVEVHALTPTAFTFLEALKSLKTVGEAFEMSQKVDPAFDLQETFTQLLSISAFARFDVQKAP